MGPHVVCIVHKDELCAHKHIGDIPSASILQFNSWWQAKKEEHCKKAGMYVRKYFANVL